MLITLTVAGLATMWGVIAVDLGQSLLVAARVCQRNQLIDVICGNLVFAADL